MSFGIRLKQGGGGALSGLNFYGTVRVVIRRTVHQCAHGITLHLGIVEGFQHCGEVVDFSEPVEALGEFL